MEIIQILIIAYLLTGDGTFCKSFIVDAQVFSSIKRFFDLSLMERVRTKWLMTGKELAKYK